MDSSNIPKSILISIGAKQGSQSIAWFASLLVIAGLIYFVYSIVLWPRYLDPLRHVPVAPGSHWFFGHLKRILAQPTGAPMREWINTVPNDGMLRYYMWYNTRVLVTKPKALADVLVINESDFAKSKIVRDTLSRFTGIGLVLQEGATHRASRRALSRPFGRRHVKNYYPLFWQKGRQLASVLQEASISESTVEIGPWSTRAAVDALVLTGFGIDLNCLNSEHPLAEAYLEIFNSASSVVGRRIQALALILPKWVVIRIPCEHNRKINHSIEVIRQSCEDIISSEKRKSLERKAQEDFSETILSYAISTNAFTSEDLVAHIMTLTAGNETNASTINASLYLLAKYPEVQTKLREAIREHVPTSSSEIVSEDIENCHYLQAVCSEILRVWPAVVHSFRTAVRDTRINGQAIGKGTSVVLSHWATNTSKELWGEDALEFKPERWLDSNGYMTAAGGASSKLSYMTFSFGPRSCIAKDFVIAGYTCMLAAIIGNLEIGFQEGSALATGSVEFVGAISNRIEGGLRCTLKKVQGWD